MHGRVASALFLLALSASAQPAPQSKDTRIPKITRRPQLEEFLNGNSRADMQRIDDFRQRSPGNGEPVSRKTQAWIGYDDKNLYAVFVCDSPPGKLRARIAKREDIFSDDVVGIFLDTYHDRQHSYEFFLNPYGVQADGVITEGRDDDFSFDTLWYSEGRITETGFAVSFAIPFKSLRFASEGVQNWGLGLGRFIPENNESSFWPFITQKIQGFSPQLGNASGLAEISPGRNIQITPYAAFGNSHFLNNTGIGTPDFESKNTFRGGFDAKAVIHDSLTLDVAVNPDFSQVESDDPQVTVNQRYAVQFPEKRPFFLENNGYFVTPENLFFSRNIVDPEYGARLTGKIGRWNLGVLEIDDRAPGIADGSNDRAHISVFRLQREFAKDSNVGAFISDREYGGSHNRVGAIDTTLKFAKNWTLVGQAIASETKLPNGRHNGGDSFNAELQGRNREWNYDLRYIDRAEGFETDLGFIQRVNIRQLQQNIHRRFHPKSKVLLSWGPNLSMSGDFDHHNVQQDWYINPGVQLEFARNTYFYVGHTEYFERFNNINFRRNDNGFGAHSEFFKKVTFDGNYGRGERINYDVVNTLPAFRGHGSELQADITIRPISRLKLDEIYFLTRLYTDDPRPQAVFINHLARSRMNYQFNKQLSLRMIFDYNAVLQNPALITLDRQKRFSGDVLLTYLLHPGTAFYIGYTDVHENLALDGGLVNRIGFPSTTTGRQFFTKLSYQFRF